jgi:hypothetical protein
MSFQNTLTEDRRLSLLLVLLETPGYSANAFLMRDAVEQIYGHNVSNDQVATDVAWLTEQGLVTSKTVGRVTLATLTRRGEDVASGRAHAPGVKKRSASGA